ncbi:MAG: phospholipase D family protein [Hyphomicrobiales bacterium]
MAKFLTTKKTSSEIEDLMIRARKFLILISPYLKLSNTYVQRLKEAASRGVRIIFVYGKEEIKEKQRNNLAEVRGLELRFFKNLHAKCYVNEENLIISSMNLYDYSEYNNREMGVLANLHQDIDLYTEAFREARSIIEFAELEEIMGENQILEKKTSDLNKTRRNTIKKKFDTKKEVNKHDHAYCIKCKTNIPFDPTNPYCNNCFKVWTQKSDINETENFCHSCGKANKGTMTKPVCYSCYKTDPTEYEGVQRTIWL